MTDIEQKALWLLNEVAIEECEEVNLAPHETLCAALRLSVIEHEDTKQELHDCKQEFSDFQQKVSDEVEKQAQTVWDIHCGCGTRHPISFNTLSQFIIPAPKPDPLYECLEEALARNGDDLTEHTDRLRAALEARGFEIRKKNDG